MTRRYAVPVEEVALAARRPRRFTWDGRAYVVAEVLGHWVTGASWWRAPALADDDTHTWRVEASAGQRSGVYDLSCSAGHWSLCRVAD